MKKHILYIVVVAGILSIFSASSTFADNVDYSVTIEPSLTLTIPSSSVVLGLDPASKTYDSKSFPVSVATNNITGYKLSVSTTGDITDLTRDISSDTTTLPTYTIPTLDSGSSYAAPSDFPANKWGYKKDSGNYIPFSSPTPLLENTTATNGDTTTLSFASKIDYTLASGAYKTTLIFTATTNPMVNYMQDLNPALCTTTPMTVVDKRDNKEYTIARLADGQCWMISNLNLAGDTTLNASDSDVPTDNYFTLPASSATGFSSDTVAYVYNTGNETTSQTDCTSTQPCNSYYSWLAATAGGKDTTGAVVTGAGYNAAYSICPRGWRLPTVTTSNAPAHTSPNWKTGDYYKLATAYGANLESQYYYQGGATFGPGTIPNFLFAGGEVNGGFYEGGSRGRYWSSTANSYTKAENILIWATGVEINSDGYGGRRSGFSVRCLLNDPRTISDITTMQEMNPQIAAKMNNGDTATLKDSRDGQDYTIAKINGNVWMTQNLRYQGDTVGSTSTTTSWIMKSATSNISANKTMTMTDLTAGNSYDVARYHDSGNTSTGVWYNYAAASAMSIIGSTNSIEATESVCPTGWRLPSSSEFNKILSYASIFNPITDGNYWGGTLNNPDQGVWWSSTAVNGINRYALVYRNNSLSVSYFGDDYRYGGHYIRCIAK